MLLRALATDPCTPAQTLTWLAGRPDLHHAAALALATNPSLPADARLNAPSFGPKHLPGAVARTDLPPARRASILAGATDFPAHIAVHDDLTPAELTAHHRAHPPTSLADHLAYLRNTHTPQHIAAQCAASAAALLPDTDLRGTLILEAATVRHRLPPAGKHAAYALTTPDPDAAFAHALLEHVKGLPLMSQALWWDAAVTAHPHPKLVAAAIQRATTAPHTTLASDLCAALLAAARVPRLDVLRLTAPDSMIRAHAAATARDEDILELATSISASECAAQNPNATATTLTALDAHLYRLWGASAAPARALLAAHPNAPADLRAAILTGADDAIHRLGQHLNDHGTTPAAVLEVPYAHLRGPHARHWAQVALTGYELAGFTPATTQALQALEEGFTGTLQELLDTAAAVAD